MKWNEKQRNKNMCGECGIFSSVLAWNLKLKIEIETCLLGYSGISVVFR
jgi:hypothetical protein